MVMPISKWFDLWRMKLNASKTKTMIVSRSHTMHPQSPALTIGGTVLNESDDLVVLGVAFDSKMTFEKHLRSVPIAASQCLGILRKSWQVFHDRLLLGRCFTGFVLPASPAIGEELLRYWLRLLYCDGCSLTCCRRGAVQVLAESPLW